MHVLEHVLHPSTFLQEVARVTRLGGFLLLSLPVAKVLRHYLYGAPYFDQDDHLSFFSLRNIGRLLSDNGYEVIAFRTSGGQDFAAETRKNWTIPPSLPLERRMAEWGGETFLDVFARRVK